MLKDHPAWRDVEKSVRDMAAAFDQQDVTAVALAKAFAEIARRLLVAMEAGGTASSRLRAVVKALDLKTPNRELQSFLARE